RCWGEGMISKRTRRLGILGAGGAKSRELKVRSSTTVMAFQLQKRRQFINSSTNRSHPPHGSKTVHDWGGFLLLSRCSAFYFSPASIYQLVLRSMDFYLRN